MTMIVIGASLQDISLQLRPWVLGMESLSPHTYYRGAELSDQQMSELDKKVEAIQSKIPIYVAVMHNSNTARNNMCLLVSHHLSVQC